MMSYERNLVVNYLSRNSTLTQASKSSRSLYFYFKDITVRYSDHWTVAPREEQLQVIRKSHEVWIRLPGEDEYVKYNEKTGYYFLRRVLKEEYSPKNIPGKRVNKYKEWKLRKQEDRKIKMCLRALKNDRLKSPQNLIYVEERLYLKMNLE